MKIYCYYQRFTQNNYGERESYYNLYAYTKEKKLADLFEMTRDMDILKRKVLDLSKDELKEFNKTYQKKHLVFIDLLTYKRNSKNKVKLTKVKVLSSEYEAMFIETESCEHPTLHNLEYIDPKLFTSKVNKCLHTLRYDNLYHLFSERYFNPEELEDDIWTEEGDIELDEFHTFMRIFIDVININTFNLFLTLD